MSKRLRFFNIGIFIKETQLLRHASTSVLPPTGRSALVIGASTGIEPLFSLHTADGVYHQLHVLLQKKTLHENDAILKEIKETGKALSTNHLTCDQICVNFDAMQKSILKQLLRLFYYLNHSYIHFGKNYSQYS